MSEFSHNKDARLSKLLELSEIILKTGNARGFIEGNQEFIATVIPSDFIFLFDELVGRGLKIDDLKGLSNKVLNIFHATIADYKGLKPDPGSFCDMMEQNNHEMEQILRGIRPVYKSFVKQPEDIQLKNKLTEQFEKLKKYSAYYMIKENILFPVIEEELPEHKCLKIMWSFHDDIRRNINKILNILKGSLEQMDEFNRSIGDVFFNMLTIKFREEKIIIPYVLSVIGNARLEMMNRQAAELGYPYIQPPNMPLSSIKPQGTPGLTDLGTGSLDPDQIRLILNHLPVEITYVDEHDKVRYFSESKDRFFPRTRAIIGRDVHNCHPPESVHVVERIIQSFRNGDEDRASFWIKLKGKYLLIQYFAMRNESKQYKGLIEVTQEISEIQKIEGDKRLLEW